MNVLLIFLRLFQVIVNDLAGVENHIPDSIAARYDLQDRYVAQGIELSGSE